jgi:hypothetical protein
MKKFVLSIGFALIGIFTFGQTYLMSNGNATTCSGTFYDSGGSGGDYGDNENFVFTFSPGTSGAALQFVFSSFGTRNGDILSIYDGLNTSATLIGNYQRNTGPGTITATNPDGALTFQFVSNGNNNRFGWVAAISCLIPPSNNLCSNATAIGEVTDLAFSTVDATASGENPICGGSFIDPIDIWYAYSPSNDGIATFDLCGSAYDTRLAIWDACGGTVLDCNDDDGPACSGTDSSIELAVYAGTTYYVQVGGYNDDTGTGDLTINLAPVAANNDCANAIAIGEVTDYPFSTIDATASGADPGCGGNNPPIDVWFTYTPSANGLATVDLCGSTYDTRLAVWSACNGTVLVCNDDDDYCGNNSIQSYVEGNVTAGTTYYIQVGGYETEIGTGDITITLTPTFGGTDCANATVINEVTDLAFNTNTATASGKVPDCGNAQAPVDLWFAYTATQTGDGYFDLCGSNYRTRLAIWDDCSSTTSSACNQTNGPICSGQQSSLIYPVVAGTTYYVQVGGRGTDTGTGDLTINVYQPAANDICANAIPINEVTDMGFSTIGATAEGISPGCGLTNPVDIWYAYTATASGTATFDLCGSSYDTGLGIWDACGGTVIACNDDDGPACAGLQSSIEIPVNAGTTYYVQVGGYGNDEGIGDLTISVVGGVQYALDFDGNVSDGSVNCGNDATTNITGPITVEAWVYVTGTTFQNWRRIVEKDWATSYFLGSGDGTNNFSFAFCMDANNDNTEVLQTGSNVFAPNEWTHVAGVWDGSNLYIYVNGILEASKPWSNTVTGSTNDLTLARYVGGAGYNLRGYMDEVRIWDVARTPAQLQDDMHRELVNPAGESNLVAYYQFNQENGLTLPDISNNNNNGILVNMNPAMDWIPSTAPIPYLSIADGNWDVDNTWNTGQMAPVNDWARVIVDNDVNLNQDQTLKALVINSGASLTVNAGSDLTMDGVLSNVAGTGGLIVEANASGMGSLIQDSPGVGATVQEYVTSERWHLISSPVSNASIGTYFDIYLKEWDEPSRTWTYLVEPITIPMNVAQGYSAWADNNYTGTTTVDFVGTLNIGDFSVSGLDYTLVGGDNQEGFNLIGNPYSSALDWNTNWTISNLSGWAMIYDNGVYRGWNPYLTGANRSYNGKLDGIIPSTQGFWLRAIATGASFTIPASERVHDAQAFYKDGEETVTPSIRLQVNINDYIDDAVVILHPQGTDEFDGLFDLSQFDNVPEAPQIYSMMNDGNFAVNVISENADEKVIPVGFKTGQAGTYSITAASLENISADFEIYLEDVQLNTLVEVVEGMSYEFNYDLLDNEHRFNLHLKDGAIGFGENGQSQLNIYSFNDHVYIRTAELEASEVVIYDIMGQEVLRELTSGTANNSFRITNGTGYYVVKLQTNSQVITEKVFIK